MSETPQTTHETMVRALVLLEQLDRRVNNLDTKLSQEYVTAKELKSFEQGQQRIESTLRDGLGKVNKDAEDTTKAFRELFVTKDQFAPVQRLVYGLVTIILTGVVGALLTVVLSQQR